MTDRDESDRRQQVLAEFGDFVLDHDDLDGILTEGCRLISDALKTQFSKVIQIEPERNTGLIRVGIGWNPGVVGHERISLSENTSEAFAIETSKPVITKNIEEETRFVFPKFLVDHGVKAIVNVPIFLPGRIPWGLLQVDDCEPRDFKRKDIEFLKVYAMVLGPVIDRLQAVAERENARAKLVEREARFHRIISQMGEGFAILDPDFLIIELNLEGSRMIDRSRENVIGRPLWEGYPGSEQADLQRSLKLAMQERIALTIEHEVFVVDRSPIWVEMRAYPNDDGTLAVFWRNVTQRRAALQELQRNEQSLRNAIEVGGIGLWDWDVLSGTMVWSEKYFHLLGHSPGEVEPSYQEGLNSLHVDDRKSEETKAKACMDTGNDYFSEFRVRHPNGSVHWLRARGRFSYGLGGEPVRMVGAAIDITELRELQERLHLLVVELQHRTRNLLGVVRSMSDMTAGSVGDFEEFRVNFRDRLDALARVQDILSQLGPEDKVAFDQLIESEMAALNGEDSSKKVTLSGPRGICLRSGSVQILAMALHELGTNALKYGALKQAGAKMVVSWSIIPERDGDQPWLQIDWRESGVTMPTMTKRVHGTGQGRELIEQALPYQLGAHTSFALGEDGVHCTIAIPVHEQG